MNSGDGPTNGFAYYFGVKDKIPHGLAGGIFLKEVMSWNYRNGYNDYVQFQNGDNKTSKKDGNNKLFDNLNELYVKHNIPKLSNYGYNSKNSMNIAREVSKALQGSFAGNPIPFTYKSAEEILNRLI